MVLVTMEETVLATLMGADDALGCRFTLVLMLWDLGRLASSVSVMSSHD